MDHLIIETEKHVIELLNKNLRSNFVYHNLSHTQNVVAKTKELITGENISEEHSNLLILAAWFHDIGYTINPENHEEESVVIAKDFLKTSSLSEQDKSTLSELILATKMGYEPKNELEKIIRDADCSHLGSKGFSDLTELLRKEWELTCDRVMTESEWLEENIKFLTNHRFYTKHASANWEKQKGKNLAQLLKSQKKLTLETNKLKQKKAELSFKKNKIELPERGIETMFRVALRNHITLSDIADTKANILLSVNAIIISLVLSNLVSKLDNPSNDYLIWPTVIFAGFTVASIVLSVLATRPNVTSWKI